MGWEMQAGEREATDRDAKENAFDPQETPKNQENLPPLDVSSPADLDPAPAQDLAQPVRAVVIAL